MCPACGKTKGAFAYYARCVEPRVVPGMIYTYFVCPVCGLVFQNPIMNEETMDRFYSEEYRMLTSQGKRPGPLPADIALEKRRSKRVIGAVEDFLKSEGNDPVIWVKSWLDVGCATGELLSQVREKFLAVDVKGVEPNESTRVMTHNKGIPVVESLEGLMCQQSIVSACHVLEHVAKPYDFLVSLRPHVAEGGLLVIDLPHIHGIQTRSLSFTHLQLFSVDALTKLVKRAGFVPEAAMEWKDIEVAKVLPSDLTLIARVDPRYNEIEAVNPPQED
jgi:SAM-dependent methyltransferase